MKIKKVFNFLNVLLLVVVFGMFSNSFKVNANSIITTEDILGDFTLLDTGASTNYTTVDIASGETTTFDISNTVTRSTQNIAYGHVGNGVKEVDLIRRSNSAQNNRN